ncbi:unnamed protein product [Darwinula stevensoni]|uniref:Chitin-binding type-2 domain-containing protein n=1 Tax=Darwinula stevensoni TaxID=69355 RepID=A0A7R9A5K6_9CRUS|nr:unnamed protein product [Darwinula stevensoni]CAG0885466.1 unnamed protein product [Darwinula stevensoni]
MFLESGLQNRETLDAFGSVDAQEFDCPPGVDGAYPHPEFCWMYYDCFNDIATLLECQLDYLFSDVNLWCDFPDVVDCGDRLPRPTGSTPSGGTDQTTPVDSSTTTIGSSTTGGGGFQCPTANGYYPHDVFCYMYYECVNFFAYPHECPGDQLFHRDLTACRPPPEVDCGNLLPRPTTPISHKDLALTVVTSVIMEVLQEIEERMPNTAKVPYDEEAMENAILAVRNCDLTVRGASKQFAVPKTTLSARLEGKAKAFIGPPPILTHEEERRLVNWIIASQKKGKSVAQGFLETAPGVDPPHPRRNHEGLGMHFEGGHSELVQERSQGNLQKGFLKRHPELTLRTPEGITKASACISKEDIRSWFKNVHQEICNENGAAALSEPERIWNADETAFELCPKSGKVLAPRGTRNVDVVAMGQKKENLTVLCNFSAAGKIAPPLIIFPYIRMPRLQRRDPENVDYSRCLGVKKSHDVLALEEDTAIRPTPQHISLQDFKDIVGGELLTALETGVRPQEQEEIWTAMVNLFRRFLSVNPTVPLLDTDADAAAAPDSMVDNPPPSPVPRRPVSPLYAQIGAVPDESQIESEELGRPGPFINDFLVWPGTPKRKGSRNTERFPWTLSSKKWKNMFRDKDDGKKKIEMQKEQRKRVREEKKELKEIEKEQRKRVREEKKELKEIEVKKRKDERKAKKNQQKSVAGEPERVTGKPKKRIKEDMVTVTNVGLTKKPGENKSTEGLRLTVAMEKITIKCIVNGFRVCGLSPWDPENRDPENVDYSRCLGVKKSHDVLALEEDTAIRPTPQHISLQDFKDIVGGELLTALKTGVRPQEQEEIWTAMVNLFRRFLNVNPTVPLLDTDADAAAAPDSMVDNPPPSPVPCRPVRTPKRKGSRNTEQFPWTLSSKKWENMFQDRDDGKKKIEMQKEQRKRVREEKKELKEIEVKKRKDERKAKKNQQKNATLSGSLGHCPKEQRKRVREEKKELKEIEVKKRKDERKAKKNQQKSVAGEPERVTGKPKKRFEEDMVTVTNVGPTKKPGENKRTEGQQLTVNTSRMMTRNAKRTIDAMN